MKAVIYARYSSDNQREESIEGQLRECKSFAEQKGITIIGTYIDRALSAKTDNRPEFQRMIADSAKKQFEVVIIWKLDRFARNRLDAATYRAILKRNGVNVVSAKENISDGPEGIILESILEGMAEYYSAELSVKVKRGQKENALKGKANGGMKPYGYTINADRYYEIDPLTAPIVAEMFERYSDGERTVKIVKSLTERGIKAKNGQPLSYNTFHNILCNRRYMGEYRYGEAVIPGGMPAIITPELFERVQARLQKNKHAPATAKAKVEYLLTTRLYCGFCGGFMVGESGTGKIGKKYHYYKCLSAKRKRGCSQTKAVKKDWIEQLVVQETVDFVLQDEQIQRMAQIIMEIQEHEDTALPLLRKQLEETEKGLQNIADAIQQGIITATTKQRLEELETAKADLEIKILQMELQKTLLTEEQIIFWISRFKNGDINDKAYQRSIIDIFVNAIYLYDDRIVLTYNYKSDARTIRLEDVEVSDLTQFAPRLGTNANPIRWFFVGEAFAFVFSICDK